MHVRFHKRHRLAISAINRLSAVVPTCCAGDPYEFAGDLVQASSHRLDERALIPRRTSRVIPVENTVVVHSGTPSQHDVSPVLGLRYLRLSVRDLTIELHRVSMNATRSFFSCEVSFVPRIRLKNSTESSNVINRPS